MSGNEAYRMALRAASEEKRKKITNAARGALHSAVDEGKSLAETMAIQLSHSSSIDNYTPDPQGDPKQEARIVRGIKILKLRNEIKSLEEEDAKSQGGARRSRKQGRSRKNKKTHRRR